jgi:hypothetical protein
MRYDPTTAIPEVLRSCLRLPAEIPFSILGGRGTATSAMTSISGFAALLFNDSLYGACVGIGILNTFSQIALYETFVRVFGPEHRTRIALATLLTPSLVFWTSALLKESVAMVGMGALVAGAHKLAYARSWVFGGLLVAAGALPFYVLKPYVLVAFIAAGGALWYARRSVRTSPRARIEVRPLHFGVAVAAATVAVAAFGTLFPEFSIEEFGEEVANLQQAGARLTAGSNVQIVDPGTRSFAGQLAFAPLALATSLFRPLIFEARGGPIAASALEMTLLTILFARALGPAQRPQLLRVLRESPAIFAGLAFVGTFGVAVGLASTNLGSLARYRVPLLPFWVLFVLLANAPRAHAAPTRAAGRYEGTPT